jgi:hypothetical protein
MHVLFNHLKKSYNMKKVILLALAGMMVLTACQKTNMAPAAKNNLSKQSNLSSTNGSSSIENIYYDGQKFMMNLNPFSDASGASLLTHNKSINNLYEASGFITVTDAIQGDGYNPVWQEVDIVFNTGVTPHQFLSDTEVLAAASGPNATITLVPTGEMYRCDIVQKSKVQ